MIDLYVRQIVSCCYCCFVRWTLLYCVRLMAWVVRPPVCHSSVCNVVAPYPEGWTFRQYFWPPNRL